MTELNFLNLFVSAFDWITGDGFDGIQKIHDLYKALTIDDKVITVSIVVGYCLRWVFESFKWRKLKKANKEMRSILVELHGSKDKDKPKQKIQTRIGEILKK